MSSCLSGGAGRTYGFDLELVKPSRSSPPRPNSHNTSSPTSTISELSNSPLSISTRKPRTPRKRPNQTYNEAAALLSSVYPSIFPTDCHQKFTKFPFFDESESSDLFLPETVDSRSLFGTRFQFEPKMSSSGEMKSNQADLSVQFGEDFDAGSILDGEIEEGIDSIMGANRDSVDESSDSGNGLMKFGVNLKLRFGVGGGRGSIRAWKRAEEMSYWWNFPTVDVLEISPKLRPSSESAAEEKKTKNKKKSKKKAEKLKSLSELKTPEIRTKVWDPIRPDAAAPSEKSELMLKLNYDGVLDAWSGKGSPYSGKSSSSGAAVASGDVSARLAHIDLFSESDIVREAVMRYKEKRRTRLFSKKIRYEVRKANADQRPRMKGRFVRRPNSPSPNEQREEATTLLTDCIGH